MNRRELIDEIQSVLDARVFRPVDDAYFLPSSRWMREFAAGLPLNLPSWEAEGYDCDDIAIEARCWATTAMRRSRIRNVGHTFGYAEVMMTRGMVLNGIEAPTSGTHATNICRTSDDGWHLIEPQTGRLCRWDDRPRGLVLAFVWL